MTLIDWAREAVRQLGKQKDAAEQIGIPYATLQRILSGTSPLTVERLGKIVAASNAASKKELSQLLQRNGGLAGTIDPDLVAIGLGAASPALQDVLNGKESAVSSNAALNDRSDQYSVEPSALSFGSDGSIGIPALTVRASAGDGSLLWGEELGQGPFRFMEDWLRRTFGSIVSLRLIQVRGDSQLPDLSDGDWAIIDTDQNKLENGLTVIRLDDCLMIKRLHREGHFLQLISRNPIYAPTVIDLSKEEYRIAGVGRVVYIFKSA